MNRPTKPKSWVVKGGLVLAVVVAIVAGVVWWQERPLRAAEARLRAGEPAAALAIVEPLLASRPQHHRALLLKARALAALERWDDAAECFARTGAATVEERRAWARTLLHQGQWGEALALLEPLAAEDPTDATLLRDLTVCHYQLGQAEAALAAANQLATLPGHETEGWFQHGVIQRALGSSHLAIESWQRIEAQSADAAGLPVPPAEFWRVYAEDLVAEARERQAAVYFERSLELQSDPVVMAQLGEAWYRAGRHSDAETAWRQVIEQQPANRDARLGLAKLALQRDDARAALEWLEPVADNTREAAYLMRRAYTLLGDETQAERWLATELLLRKSERLQAALSD